MKECRQCGRELPAHWSTDICLECSRDNIRKIFKENPDIKEAFEESIEEMRNSDCISKMVNNTCDFLTNVQKALK